jgi:threonine/homoserine/homoserine lactone efflux protein
MRGKPPYRRPGAVDAICHGRRKAVSAQPIPLSVHHIPNAFLIIPVGFIAGLLLALPFGPINLLGLQRAVERGFFGGMAAGIGIMLGDALIALFAAFGVSAVTGAIYAGVGSFVEVDTVLDALAMVAAIMCGSFVYWFVVSERIALIRHRLDEVQLGRINALAGLILIGFGALLIAEIVLRWVVLWGLARLF